MAFNFVLFSYGWELQHVEKKEGGVGDADLTDPLLGPPKEGVSGGDRDRGRSWSGHSSNPRHSATSSHGRVVDGRVVSVDYDSDAHQEGIVKLRCSSTGGFL